MKKYLPLFLFILASQSAGIIGSIFTSSAIPTWYVTLAKPVFNPPNWIFAPVWILLYTMMGVATYLVWKKRQEKKAVKFALIVFFLHLILNAVWSIIFFGLQNLLLALVIIFVLGLMIAYIIYLYYGLDRLAAYLLVPYLVWVSFATLLNYSILVLNK